jgi:hypothetical protein
MRARGRSSSLLLSISWSSQAGVDLFAQLVGNNNGFCVESMAVWKRGVIPDGIEGAEAKNGGLRHPGGGGGF